ncbi:MULTISPECIES: non-ribosomal peptide synthetase [Pseudomonas]|uniref:Amino acid adenylation domain-containing protein n=1 Tax=Pseudomonas quercus TaxID=2722792 RepID=A0ABX0Y8H7_9PSED|nr:MULTISPECIES: non-ribosomal peptide synthetase [Pseudomonas]MBF7140779.1 amino acid adenylation domain-containing protein [Pseudomonas sp. LY10J]NJO99315.1 amino acid adenylation domain-containing protein [Pseudomonas quercus]
MSMTSDAMPTGSPFRRKSNIESVQHLVGVQPGLLSQALQAGGDDPYFSQYVFELDGTLDVAAFEAAWRDVILRHEILRADFRWQGLSQPAMVVYRDTGLGCTHLDWSALGAAQQQAQLDAAWAQCRAQGFDLENAADLQLQLIALGEGRYWFVWRLHHVQLDGWSLPIVLRDVMALYTQAVGEASGNEPLGAHPAPRLKAYRQWLDAQDRGAAEQRWCDALAPFSVPTPLPVSAGNATAGGRRYAEWRWRLAGDDSQALAAFAREQRVTLGSLVQAAWGLLLARHADRDEAVFGVTGSGRPAEVDGMQAMVGVFINTVPMPVHIPAAQPLGEWLRAVQAQAFALRAVEHVPLAQIQAVSNGGRAVFDSIVVVENYPVEAGGAQAAGLRVRLLGLGDKPALGRRDTDGRNPYPLSLIVAAGATFDYVLAYDTRRVDHATVERLGEQLGALLRAFVTHGNTPVGELGLGLAEAPAVAKAPAVPGLLARIARHAATQPQAAALSDGEQVLGWATLWQRAGQLAAQLRHLGVAPEQRVALALPRGPAFVTAIVAVWRAGGAYVPLDVDAPGERLAWQTQDSACVCVLAAQGAPAWLPEGMACLDLQAPVGAPWLTTLPGDTFPADTFPGDAGPLPGQLAYVIYTSGSTGRPKGVAVPHQALDAYLAALIARLPEGIERAACLSTPAADLGHTTLFGALWAGWTLHVPPQAVSQDADLCAQYMARERIDLLKIVPSHLGGLLQAAEPAQVLPARCLVLGGEAASPALLAQLDTLAPHCQVLNHYGPSETTVGALTWHRVQGSASQWPLGQPLSHAQVQLQDAHGNPAGAGARGELCIGGQGVARGYQGQPALTAERFTPDPLGQGTRVYRTGDRAYRDADGQFVFLGRRDDQVKIRGYRVEPEEVAHCLRAQPGVTEAVVIARCDEAERMQLHGFVTGQGLDTAHLRSALQALLPPAWVPDTLTVLASLPLTHNGKVDRQALAPAPTLAAPQAAPAAPGSATEAALLDIWQGTLGRADIGVNDNFFEIGGDSILSLRIIAKARQAGIGLTPRQLFEHPTIAGAAAVAKAVTAKTRPTAAAAPTVNQGQPLTPIQARFFEEHSQAPSHWNQSLLLASTGGLSWDAVQVAVSAVMASHDALRLRFSRGLQGRWEQQVAPQATASLARVDLRASEDWRADLAQAGEQVQASLDLAKGPLWRGALFDLPDGSSRLLLAVHHLGIDGVSWRILLEDLEQAYTQALTGAAPQVPAPGTTWAEWATALARHAQQPEVQAELPFWQQHLAATAAWDAPTRARGGLPLAAPLADVAHALSSTQTLTHTLDAKRTQALLVDVPGAYRTRVDEVLLAALTDALTHWSETAGVLVELEGHGREDVMAELDLSRTVGWFTTRFPTWLATGVSPVHTLANVKRTLRGLPHKGLHFGVLRYLGTPDTQAALARLPRPSVSFNYLGQFGQGQEGASVMRIASGEAAGQAVNGAEPCEHALAFNAWIVEGQLTVEWRHLPAVLAPALAQVLADDFDTRLRHLIDHCAQAPRGATAEDFPLAGLDAAGLQALNLPLGDVADIYPATSLQQGLIYHAQRRQGSGTYVNQLQLRLEGALDTARLAQAWQATVARHDILRTAFHHRADGELLQVVLREVPWAPQVHDWRGTSATQAPEALDRWCRDDLAQGVAIDQAPLMRVNLFQLADGTHELVWTSHHALTDGWSSSRVLDEVAAHYAAEGRANLPAPGRYRDYVAWLARQNTGEAYWQARFAEADAPAMLAGVLGSAAQPRPGIGHLEQAVPAALDNAARAAAQQARVTLNTLIQGAWALLLARYGGRDSVRFGVTTSGRSMGEAQVPGIENMPGLFINSLPLNLHVPAAVAPGAWLRQVQQANAELRDHEHNALAQVQRWVGLRGEALFDSLLVFENYDTGDAAKHAANGDGQPLRIRTAKAVNRTHYPLTLSVTPGAPLALEWAWDSQLLDRDLVQRLAQDFQHLLAQLSQPACGALGTLSLAAHRPAAPVALARPFEALPQRLATAAQAWPTRVAVGSGERHLTYLQLQGASHALARHLLALGVQAEARVGVCMARGVGLPVALLGVLASGACYVPLDPHYPAARLQLMMEDAGVQVVICDAASRQHLLDENALPAQVALVSLEDLNPGAATTPLPVLHAEQLAYVIYTSGSTGTPKGVAISHGALDRFLRAMVQAPGITTDDVLLCVTSPSFDIFALEAYAPLLVGARVEVAARADVLDGERLAQRLAACGATLMQATPSGWKLLLASDWQAPEGFRALCGGEALPQDLAATLQARGAQVWNLYGPTETTVWSSVAQVAQGADIHLGTAVAHNSLQVLDAHGQAVPAGGVGELYIGGDNLARGYLGRAALTAEHFLPDPFGAPGARRYRTGDRCQVGLDGRLQYQGRLDQQVKLRGQRIEPGEIEAVLRAQPGVTDAAVLVVDTGAGVARLAAFVIPVTAVPTDLEQALAAQLPAHMVPSLWHLLPTLPQIPNGKLDRRALAQQGAEAQPTSLARRAPVTALQGRIVEQWQALLGLPAIGIDEDFFQLGGDSLLAMRAMAQLRNSGIRGGSLETLFVQRTPSALATAIEQAIVGLPDNLVVLEEGDAGAPTLFCLHPGFGLVNRYAPLAKTLGRQWRVIGVQSPRYADPHWAPADFAAWIADYARRLRQARPHGPYRLLGWSLGGLLATHLAQALAAEGESVAWVGVLDSDPQPLAVDPAEQALDPATLAAYLAPHHGSGGDTVQALQAVIQQHRRLLPGRTPLCLAHDLHVWRVADGERHTAAAWAATTHGTAHAVDVLATTHEDIVDHPQVLQAVAQALHSDLKRTF